MTAMPYLLTLLLWGALVVLSGLGHFSSDERKGDAYYGAATACGFVSIITLIAGL